MATPRIRVTGRFSVLGRPCERDRKARHRADLESPVDSARIPLGISDWNALLASCLDLEPTLRRVAEIAIADLADLCAVILVEDGCARVVASAEADPGVTPIVEEIYRRSPIDLDPAQPLGRELVSGPAGLCARIVPEELAAVAGDEERLALLRALRLVSALWVPLVARERRLGCLVLLSTRPSRGYRRSDLARAEDLAAHAALAIDNALEVATTRRALAAREELVSVLAHELKSPLSTLDLSLRVLESGERAERDRALAAMQRQVARMRRLVDNLLDAARIASDHLAVLLNPGDLKELVRDAAERMRDECVRAGCDLRFRADGPIAGLWDPVRIEQVVSNLLSNAMKYGSGHPIQLQVERAGPAARVTVRDSGPGIPPDELERIFERFERGGRDYRRAPGAGLGLWIVRRSVEAMGGTVRAANPQGAGAELVVELPIRSHH